MSDFPATGTWAPSAGTIDLSSTTVTFGLEAADIPDISGTAGAIGATLVDVGDGTIAADLVNTANPWADNEVANDLTISGGTVNNSIIGGSTPAAGTFTTLTTTGAVTIGGDIALGAHEIQSTTNVGVQLGDNAGAYKWFVQDSDGVEVFYVNSDGGQGGAAANNPYFYFNENDGTDYWAGIYDTTVDRWEIRRNATAGTDVDFYADLNGMYSIGNCNLATGHNYQINGTQIALANLSDGADHDARHERAGADEIDGDHLDIDFTPSNYTPATTPAEAANVDDLAAHLQGIDTVLGATGTGTLAGMTDTTITTPSSGQILIYGSTWDNKTMSGDAEIDSSGVLTIAATSVEASMLAADAKFQALAVAALNDSTTPSVLTTAETTNKCISNYKASGADHVFTFPAAHAAGNVIFPIGDEFQVDLEPPSGTAFYLNGTAMANDEHIQNTADTLGDRIVCYCSNINGTLTWMCYSSDSNWVEASP
jgi:hypothetical protein